LYRIQVQVEGFITMSETTTYSAARAHLASLCDQVAATREPVIIRRRNAADVALIAADELAGLLETAHLLRSPRNAQRLLTALARAESGDGEPADPETLRERLGLS
jgi:antitoxin YefM